MSSIRPDSASFTYTPAVMCMADTSTNPSLMPLRAVISATLDGTVIFTGWTMETGWVIQIQHSNNLISVYKHNVTLLKQMGDEVVAGEGIAVVGDSGELYTSGPHLHFEIWYKGKAVNPENYILF